MTFLKKAKQDGAIGGQVGGQAVGAIVKIGEELGTIEDRIKVGKEINIQYFSSVFEVFSDFFNEEYGITSEKLQETFGMTSAKLQESFRKAFAKLVFNTGNDSYLSGYYCGRYLENYRHIRKNRL